MVLGEPIKGAFRIMGSESVLNGIAKSIHAGGEKFQDDRGTKAIDYESAQTVPFGVDQAICIADGIQAEPGAAQRDGMVQAAFEEFGINEFVLIARQDTQGNARMSVVESAADPLAVSICDVHNAAGGQSACRLLDHLLENPRMRGAPRDFQADLGQGCRFHKNWEPEALARKSLASGSLQNLACWQSLPEN